MDVNAINSLEQEGLQERFKDVVNLFTANATEKEDRIKKSIAEFDLEHSILTDSERQDKIIGKGDNARIVKKAKLIVSMQKKIVNVAVAFIFGNPVRLLLNNAVKNNQILTGFNLISEIWRSLKLDFHNRRLARRVLVEGEAAELFYVQKQPSGEKKLKVMLLCRKNGDELYPHFDAYGDMDAYMRKYSALDVDGKVRQHVDIYTAEKNITAIHRDRWEVTISPNLFKKIPIIHYSQDGSEWSDVQTLIDRIEMLISRNADTNDYFGSPAIVSKGKIAKAPDKSEVAKFFQLEGKEMNGKIEYGDLRYLTWDRAPEAIKVEYEILKDLIYSQTATPDISFNNVKGIGDISGIALKFMFMDALLKAKDKQEIFGEGLERRLNLIRAIVEKVLDVKQAEAMRKLQIGVEFRDVLPENVKEVVEMLSMATGGEKVMSTETALNHNPLVADPAAERERIQAEQQVINESFNV